MLDARSRTVRPLLALVLACTLVMPVVAAAPASGGETTGSVLPTVTPDPSAQPDASSTATSPLAAGSPSLSLATTPSVQSPGPVGLLAEDADSRVSFSGPWFALSSPAFTGGSYRYSAAAGSTVTVAVSGTGIAVIGSKGPSYGNIEVIVDGISRGTVSCYAASYAHQQSLYALTGLADRVHSITIRVTGTRSAASSGTVVVFDAFEVSSTGNPAAIYIGFMRAEENSPRLKLSGFTARAASPVFSGGGYTYSAQAGASISTAFRGTDLAILGSVGPSYGNVEIVIDGVSRGIISTYAGSYTHHVAIYSESGFSDGVHTLSIVVCGTKEAASSGAIVIFDAIEVSSLRTAAVIYGGFQHIQDSNAKVKYAGTWITSTSSAFSGGGYSYSATAGSTMVAVFRGSDVTVYGARGPSYGRVEVFIDGVSKGVVDLYAASYEPGAPIISASGLDAGIHALTVKVLGTKSANSSGKVVVLDAVQTLTTLSSGSAYFETAPTLAYSWSTYIVVDKSDFRLYWVRNGVLRSVYPIAHGKVNTPTPSATWRIDAKYKTDPSSVYGPRKMRLFRQSGSGYAYTAYAIHGTNEPWVIGTQASHGCIRMYNSDVLKLWPEVPLRTMVVTRN